MYHYIRQIAASGLAGRYMQKSDAPGGSLLRMLMSSRASGTAGAGASPSERSVFGVLHMTCHQHQELHTSGNGIGTYCCCVSVNSIVIFEGQAN